MKVVVQSVVAGASPRGVGRYVVGLSNGVESFDHPDVEFVFLRASWMTEYAFNQSALVHTVRVPTGKIGRHFWNIFIFPFYAKFKLKANAVIYPNTTFVIIKLFKVLSIIHDIAEFYPQSHYSRIRTFIRRLEVRLQVLLSDRILTVSEYSRKDIIQRLSISASKVHYVWSGASASCEVEILPFEKRRYLVCVGPMDKYKNIDVAVRAFLSVSDLIPEVSLYVLGTGGDGEVELTELLAEIPVPNRIVRTGFVTEQEKYDILSRSIALLFLSDFEGFGLPIVEAMSVGTPVIASTATCIPEICGDAGILVTPQDEREVQEAILRICGSFSLWSCLSDAAKRRAKTFDWSRVGRGIVTIFQNAGQNVEGDMTEEPSAW